MALGEGLLSLWGARATPSFEPELLEPAGAQPHRADPAEPSSNFAQQSLAHRVGDTGSEGGGQAAASKATPQLLTLHTGKLRQRAAPQPQPANPELGRFKLSSTPSKSDSAGRPQAMHNSSKLLAAAAPALLRGPAQVKSPG